MTGYVGTCNRTRAEVPLDAIQPFDRPAALARDQKCGIRRATEEGQGGSAAGPAWGVSTSSGMGYGVPNMLGEEAPHARPQRHIVSR